MRVVSLVCSNTEIVCALGCGEMLVGVDSNSDFPEGIKDLPKVGRDLEIDPEKVAALKPDLVLASLTVPGHDKVLSRLSAARLPFVSLAPRSLGDIYGDIRKIASLLGVEERGERLVASMQEQIPNPPPAKVRGQRRPSLLVQWWPKPVIAPGRCSWLHDLLEAAGAGHPLEGEEVESRPLTDAEVAAASPDAVILSWCGVKTEKYRPDVIYRNEAWKTQSFVTEKRVFCIGEPFVGRPGPRLVEGYRALRAIVEALEPSFGGLCPPDHPQGV